MTTMNKKNLNGSQSAIKTCSKDWKLEFFALSGFCVSGAIFIMSGIENKDVLTISGSLVWMVSCLVWMIPYKKYFSCSRQGP